MKKRILVVFFTGVMVMSSLAGCGATSAAPEKTTEVIAETIAVQEAESQPLENKFEENQETEKATILADGVYKADFHTDSGMFHANEADEGKGVLMVKDGEMTLHVSMPSKNIVNLFFGTAEEAKKEGAKLLNPTVDSVTYSDGITEEVHGFDIPVPSIDEEFDVALIGKKGKWYDHKVSVSNPEKVE